MLSMTAFCRKQAEFEAGTLIWEIRSVNHRFLEISMRLPEPLRAMETTLRKIIRGRVKRGKVDCALRFQESEASLGELHLNARVLQGLAEAGEQIHYAFGDSRLPSSLDILNWPGVIRSEGREHGDLEPQALGLFNEALDALLAGRAGEGGEIAAVVRGRVLSMKEILAQTRAALPEILAEQRQSLLDSIARLEASLEPERLEQEVALLASKADIAEELDRLDAHVKELERLLDVSEPVGRKLDFLLQELMREANTICSKAAVIATTRDALELKVLIEQIREQVQNIE